MIIYLIAVAEALVYLASIPLCVAVRVTTRGGARVGVGVGAFERRFAQRRARKASKPLSLPEGGKKGPGARLAWGVARRLRGAGVTLRGTLCLGDAAATALACGTLQALGAALGGGAARVTIDVRPRFDGMDVEARLQGMLRARTGQIILAAARCGVDSVNRRISQWTSIPSRA